MRDRPPAKLENGRILSGPWGSDASYGMCGAFFVRRSLTGPVMKIIASDGGDNESEGWEHVSVSMPSRCPTWEEMCFVKDLFWRDDETVVQFHPPEADYVNHHPYCLHLWRHQTVPFKMPPPILVGPK